jgi:hypothetical protein
LILDAGAFIAFEKGDVAMRARLAAARRLGMDLATTSPVIGQVWRDGRRQALLARLVTATFVAAPDAASARRAGELLAKTKGHDVVDALLVGLVRKGDIVATSDQNDIRSLLRAAGTNASVVPV